MNDLDLNLKFTPEFRAQVSTNILHLLDDFEKIASTLEFHHEKTVIWQPPAQFPKLLDHYLDALFTIYINKYYVLCKSLIEGLNAGNFFIYGLIGRSLIEHTAILRYYVTSKTIPLAEAAAEDGIITEEEWQDILQCLNKHLTGHRFDWKNFLGDYFQQEEIDDSHPHDFKQEQQINVITCLEKWMKQKPEIANLYSLFCDLVHPNLGSNLLIARIVDRKIGLGGSQGKPMGLEIMNRTFANLLELFQEVYTQLMLLKKLKHTKIFK